MKFLSIELQDIFAYRTHSHIDLSECDEERNIVVVQGQNGFGKTSLLNGVKLLFLGVADKDLRRVSFGNAPISEKHYVLGQPGRWYGVINTDARRNGLPARVALEWEHQDLKYRAERVFFALRNGTDYSDELNITINGRPMDNRAEAEAVLLGLVPREAVKYFLFDGEQIQSIADAEIGRERTEIEHLLGFTFFEDLAVAVTEYGREKRRTALPSQVQAEIKAIEAAQAAAEAQAEAAERAKVRAQDEILELDRRKRLLEAERNQLRAGVSEEERHRTDMRISALRLQREKLARRIADAIPDQSPALANLTLVRRAFATLEQQFASGADATIAERLHRRLPEALVATLTAQEPPLEITPSQASQFKAEVRRLLVENGVSAEVVDAGLFSALSPNRLLALRDQLATWDTAGPTLIGNQVALLRQSRELLHEEQKLIREMEEAEIVSDEARTRYAALTTELDECEQEARERLIEADRQRDVEEKARANAASLAGSVAKKYEEHERAKKVSAEFELSQKTKTALEYFRDERRKLFRASVETAMKRRVQLLLGPTQLVRDVTLDNQFGTTYYDSHGEVVARHSLSAGMRQLAAMAFLWALKDVARKPLPVIIDTPLGRIDRTNRSILMTDYFPAAGNPLILLPTNIELSEDDLAGLSGRIAKRYVLENGDSHSARIVPVRGR